MFNPPFGWRAQLVEVPKEQAVIAQIRKLQTSGFGYLRIANALNEGGVNPRSRKPWTPDAVRRILKRPAKQKEKKP